MSMWYRTAQNDETPVESPKSGLSIKEITPEELKLAENLLKLKQDPLFGADTKPEDLKKAFENYKESFVQIKKISSLIKSIGDSLPFEALKPTVLSLAYSLNDFAESYTTSIGLSAAPDTKNKMQAGLEATKKLSEFAITDLDSAKKFVQNLDSKEVAYYINLIGDLGPPVLQPFLIPVKIADYRATWIPMAEDHYKKFNLALEKFNSSKDPNIKEAAKTDILKHLSGLLGFVSNALIDLGSALRLASAVFPPILPFALTAIGLGAVLQGASTLMEPGSPLNYKEIGKIPGQLVDSMARISVGLPATESKVEEKPFQSFQEGLKRGVDPTEKFTKDQYYPLYEGLKTEFLNYDAKAWENKYGSKKDNDNLEYQPLNTIMKFAYDKYKNKYPWLNDPSATQYRNFAAYAAVRRNAYQNKSITPGMPKPKSPSKKSIAYNLLDSALRNNMTNQFTSTLLKEVAQKYAGGSIYNFLNKKNIDILTNIETEARNANFAARFNLRPNSAGWDSLKIDIMNLKRIINTWK